MVTSSYLLHHISIVSRIRLGANAGGLLSLPTPAPQFFVSPHFGAPRFSNLSQHHLHLHPTQSRAAGVANFLLSASPSSHQHLKMPRPNGDGKLSEADTQLFESGNFADATIVCGDRTWKVHKLILSSRCKWFKAAFYGNMAVSTELMALEIYCNLLSVS